MMVNSVEVEGLVVRYHEKEALHGITFRLRPGEVVGLLGPNGAGKSTTVKVLTGILVPSAGRVRLNGFSLADQRLEAKRIIGYVPEAAVLYESLSAKEFLELTGRLRGIEEKKLQRKISELLEAFDLAGVRLKRLAAYSKGMKQKVLIVAALLHDPEILLLDEPLSGLDVMSSVLLKEILAALAGQGKTILYSSHVLDVVEKICSRVLIIHRGNLIADGTLETLKEKTAGSTLEAVFREVTQSSDPAPLVARILGAVKL